LPVPGWAAGPPRVAMCFALAWPFALPLAFALAWRFTLAWPLRLAGPVALPWLSTLPGSAGREVAWGFSFGQIVDSCDAGTSPPQEPSPDPIRAGLG